ncbi:hypothetical protein P3X46_011491 [Hevea brasiliensis]|uniref:Protein kinase domain-containing protein n=1 Tax=Hevea brasiliensis TaxID=3981 RepID=A0ABQ9M8F0_HEVBR|nr:probable serine/threonine-protein kinase PIX13 [Hevea brasiliensis]KAJ9176148.1 hypothetical protein P3X46_011491 [Hevea brasiliensis]
MGNCWCRPAHKPTPDHPTNIHHVTASNTAPADENVYDSNGYSATSTNLTTWISQSSGSFTTIWGNNATEQIEAFTNGPIIAYSNLRAFTYAQLKAATHNFRPDMVVGKGGFGVVYKGWLKEKVMPRGIRKTAMAIKKLNPESGQGAQEWKAEVNLLGSLSHPNLVQLLGYCHEDGKFILIYEFMKKGSLNRYLFGKRSVQRLPWDTRLKVAIGTARGLDYLHSLEKPIIYRDFKSSNILLDEFYDAKIADFGLAFFGPLTDNSHVSTLVMGTLGYADPEYVSTGHLFVKSDVYSFGVVLVEMLTGLRAFDRKRPSGQRVLVDWVKPHLTKRKGLKNIMDSRLEGKYPSKEAKQIAYLAVKCLRPEPLLRPSMKEVVETLEQIEAVSLRTGDHNIHSTEQHN